MISYGNFTTQDLSGSSLGELLVNIEADLAVTDGDGRIVYSEYRFPVAELALELMAWIDREDEGLEDFSFDSMSFEESGSIRISADGAGWRVGSVFRPDEWTQPVSIDALKAEITRFVDSVRVDVATAGIDPLFLDATGGA